MARNAITPPTRAAQLRAVEAIDAKIEAANSMDEIRELVALRGAIISQDPKIQLAARRASQDGRQLVVDSLFRAFSFFAGLYIILSASDLRLLGALLMGVGVFHVAQKSSSDGSAV